MMVAMAMMTSQKEISHSLFFFFVSHVEQNSSGFDFIAGIFFSVASSSPQLVGATWRRRRRG
jgi:hypothetical protein